MGTLYIKPPSADTYIIKKRYFLTGALNCYKSESLIVGRKAGRLYRSLLKFDLPPLASDRKIINAYLKLYLYRNECDSMTTTVDIHQVLSKYNPQKTTWKNQPIVNITPISSINLQDEVNIFVPFNITCLVENWLSGMSINFGVLIKQRHESINTALGFRSGQFIDSHKWPFLEINYLEPLDRIIGCPQVIDLVENALSTDEWNQTAVTDILLFNYSYIIVNTGNNPVLAYLQQSADGEHWEDETIIHKIDGGTTITLIPDYIVKYARVRYRSEYPHQSTTLNIYVQGRTLT